MRRNISILELSFSCILEIQPERSEQTLDVLRNQRISGTPEIARQFLSGMKWSPEWLDFYDTMTIVNF